MFKKIINKIKFKKNKSSRSLFIDDYKKKNLLKNLGKKSFKRRKSKINIKQLSINKFINIDLSKIKVFYIAIIFLIPILLIFLLVSPIFSIKKVNIIKKDSITNIDIAYKVVEYIRGKSIFLIDRKKIKQNLESYQKNIKDVEIKITLPNTIKILIGSYPSIFNTKIKDKSYIITKNGVLIPSKASKELRIFKIKGKIKNNGIIDYKKVLDGNHLKNIEKLIKEIEKNIIGLHIKDIEYYITEREAHLYIENDTRIIFDLTKDVLEQIEKIVIFNKENFSLKNKKMVYIDLRIKEKIFYCELENEFICKQNLKKIYP